MTISEVISHARNKKKRGRQPSLPFLWEKNPRRALRLAQQALGGRILLVWNKLQKVPATVYAKAHWKNSDWTILVCNNPETELAQLRNVGGDGIIYFFR